MNTSRRSFLKVAGLSAFALSSGMASLAGTAGAARAQIAPGRYEKGEHALTAKRWARSSTPASSAAPKTTSR